MKIKSISFIILCLPLLVLTVFTSSMEASDTAFPTTKHIYAGAANSLLINEKGEAWVWGNNELGQLGLGTQEDVLIPVQYLAVKDIATFSSTSFSLFLTKDGKVWSVGNNRYGQLGNGSNVSSNIPKQVDGIENIIQITSGLLHAVALKNDGTVWSWGNMRDPEPEKIENLEQVIAVVSGANHTLALKKDGTVWAWGSNIYGQIGYGNNLTYYYDTPVQVKGLEKITKIAVGELNHSMALKEDGTVWVWGNNEYAQLGNSQMALSAVPVKINGLTKMKDIAAGGTYSLALDQNGKVFTWGKDPKDTQADTPYPKEVAGLSNIVEIDAGFNFCLAYDKKGNVFGWGNNEYGQLGDGTQVNSLVPKVIVKGVTTIIKQ